MHFSIETAKTYSEVFENLEKSAQQMILSRLDISDYVALSALPGSFSIILFEAMTQEVTESFESAEIH